MAITISGYLFDGPHNTTDALEDRSGVYVILTRQDNQYIVLDCGESATVHTRVANHDRAESWSRNALNGLFCAVCYTPSLQQAGRRVIEQKIRANYQPPCGDR